MAEPSPLTPRDYDPWQHATALHLLTLLERLGVRMSEVARWLHVPRSSVSTWRHGTKAVPPKHLPTLRERAHQRLLEAADLTDKAAQLAPTAALGEALQHEFAALYGRWKAEVLAEAGTLRRSLERNRQALDAVLAHQPFAAADPETLDLVWSTIRQQVTLLIALEGTAPAPEEALIAQRTAAREAAGPVVLSPEERARAEADMPETLSTPHDEDD